MPMLDSYTFIALIIWSCVFIIFDKNTRPSEEELRMRRLLISVQTINAYCAEKLENNCDNCVVRKWVYCERR